MSAESTSSREAVYAQFSVELADYIAHADEASLGRAYELGRAAMTEGWSIPDLVAVHGKALQAFLVKAGAHEAVGHTVVAAAAFLAEVLSSYEMTHRGYRDTVVALRHLNETLEQQIRRIAHAMHDEAGQLLTSVHLAVAALEREIPGTAHARVREVRGLLDQVECQLRSLSHELRPTILDDLGWLPAIRFLAESIAARAQIPIEVRSSVEERLPASVETALYRGVQEALTNATRHAKATRVRIEVDRIADSLSCRIIDDGVGFNIGAQGASGGLGLMGMRERLSAVGGRMDILSSPGRGTQIHLQLPMEKAGVRSRHSGG